MTLAISGVLKFKADATYPTRSIQTEFNVGGAGVSAKFSSYVRGGAFVPDGPAANANISTSVNGLAVTQFYGAVAFTVLLDNHSISDIGYTEGGALTVVTYMVARDGLVYAAPQATPANNWGTPALPDSGDNYWVMADNYSVTVPSEIPAASGIWIPITSDRYWRNINNGGGAGSVIIEQGTFDVHIGAADGGPIIDSATITWYTESGNDS